tara:strand:+ start:1463 stop:1687 length:225 start_codon:yes stop_codon:yes gene_type:complete
MTFEEYEQGYYSGDSEDPSGPSEDPETHDMLEHLVEFETEMFRLDCRRRLKGLSYKQLETLLVDLHGREWKDAL